MTEIDISELELHSKIDEIDGYGQKTVEKLANHDITFLDDINDVCNENSSSRKSENVYTDYLSENVEGIGQKRQEELISAVREMTNNRQERLDAQEDEDDYDDFGGDSKDFESMDVAIFASSGWTMQRSKRDLVGKTKEAIYNVRTMFDEALGSLRWIEGPDNEDTPANAKHYVFQQAVEEVCQSYQELGHYVLPIEQQIDWNDIPDDHDCWKEWQYPDPTDHPEIGRNPYGLYSNKAPLKKKRDMMQDVDVAIIMDNYDFVVQDIRMAESCRCAVYVREAEKHHLDPIGEKMDGLPKHVGTPSKDAHFDVSEGFTDEKRRTIRRDEDVTPTDYSEHPEVTDGQWEYTRHKPFDGGDQRGNNPRSELPDTMEQENNRTFTKPERKDKRGERKDNRSL